MHALAAERIQVTRQRRHQGFTLAGTHFRNFAVVQRHATDELHIEVAHAQRADAGFTAHCEGFGQQRVERLTVGNPLLELDRFSGQLLIGELLNIRFQRVDRCYCGLVAFQQSVIATTKDSGQ